MSAENNQPVYFTKLEIDNVMCFKKPQAISFLDKNGAPALFTVILGNNNTGKTTILKMLGGWENIYISFENNIPLHLKFRLFPLNNHYRYTILSNTPLSWVMDWNHTGGNANNQNIKEYIFNLSAYGVNRKTGSQNARDYDIENIENRTKTLFENEGTPYLLNTENWFVSLMADIGEAFTKEETEQAKLLQERLQLAKNIVNEIFASAEQTSNKDIISIESGKVFFTTALGDKVRLSHLGSGYQSLLTWVLDLAYRMFKRYPESENPIKEPAIVLVDELDLHLHPEWQRRVVSFLRKLFPKTQFIVTAHSPLVVQSAADLNVIVLQKNPETQSVDIIDANDKFNTETFEGWTLEEILRSLMMEKSENLYSDTYNQEREKFDKALDNDDIKAAEEAYKKLIAILHPNSKESKMMQIQMIGLTKLNKNSNQ